MRERTLGRERRTTRGSPSKDVMLCLPKDLLQTIQVVLAPAMFDIERTFNHFSFPVSQQAVYGTASEYQAFG